MPTNPKTTAKRPINTFHRKAANTRVGGSANRQKAPADPATVPSERAIELAKLLKSQARDQDAADILGAGDDGYLPQLVQRLLDDSLTSGPQATQARGLLLRIMKHPAASAAEGARTDAGRPGALRAGLVGRLSGASGRVDATPGSAGSDKPLPF